MGKIDDVLKSVVNNVDGAVACGVVDLDSGMLLGIYNAASYTQGLNELVAGATMDMFRGPNISRIEEAVRSPRGCAPRPGCGRRVKYTSSVCSAPWRSYVDEACGS